MGKIMNHVNQLQKYLDHDAAVVGFAAAVPAAVAAAPAAAIGVSADGVAAAGVAADFDGLLHMLLPQLLLLWLLLLCG